MTANERADPASVIGLLIVRTRRPLRLDPGLADTIVKLSVRAEKSVERQPESTNLPAGDAIGGEFVVDDEQWLIRCEQFIAHTAPGNRNTSKALRIE